MVHICVLFIRHAFYVNIDRMRTVYDTVKARGHFFFSLLVERYICLAYILSYGIFI
jgi:hypothetical protein